MDSTDLHDSSCGSECNMLCILLNFLAMASLPKGPAACCIGSLLLLVPTYATQEIYSPWAVSQKFEILSATFSRSAPLDTAKYCIKPGVKSRLQELLSLQNIAFFQKKICCKFTSQSESWRLLCCFLFCMSPRWAHGPGSCEILGATHGRFFKKNGESLRLRCLDGIENCGVSLQSCGVSQGLEIRKVALRIWDFRETARGLHILRGPRTAPRRRTSLILKWRHAI